MLINIICLIGAYIGMEGVAWLTHKYIMHGFLWYLHEDHHKKSRFGFYEKNDFFFLIFAIPGIISLFTGIRYDFNFLFFIGLGITLYGFTYFLVHDMYIHQRFEIFRHINNRYLKAVKRAHKAHHSSIVKEGGQCFGMLYFPNKYLKDNSTDGTH